MRLLADLLIFAGIALLVWGCGRINTTFGILVAGSLLGASGLALAKANQQEKP